MLQSEFLPALRAVPAPDRRYVGERSASGARVVAHDGETSAVVVDRAAWGERGAETDALAWALLLDASGSRVFADDWHVDLADELIARLPLEGFELGAADVLDWLAGVPA